MKKQLFTYLSILFFTVTAANANPDKPVSSVAVFSFENVHSGETLLIKNVENELIYTEDITLSGVYFKKFDLSSLQDGTYKLILERADRFEIQSFEINQGSMISGSEKTMVYKPTAQLIKDRLYISQYATTESKLAISIYYQGELIHSSQVTGIKTIGKIFKLDSTRKGEYTIILKSHGETFYNHVEM